MEQTNPHLFVYGTLLYSNNSYGAYLQQYCSLQQPGKFKGLLYDMGDYPGAIADAGSDRYVHGNIYIMHEPEKVLAFIDDYEGFGDKQEQPNLFIRIQAFVETMAGQAECWVYVYNLPVEGLSRIRSGRYKAPPNPPREGGT